MDLPCGIYACDSYRIVVTRAAHDPNTKHVILFGSNGTTVSVIDAEKGFSSLWKLRWKPIDKIGVTIG